MVAKAQDPRWWETRQTALDVDVARLGSDPKENQINWNGSEALAPPKSRKMAVWGELKGTGRSEAVRPKGRRWRRLSPRSAQTRSSPRAATFGQRRVSPRAGARSSTRVTVERNDRKIQKLITGGPVLLSPRVGDENSYVTETSIRRQPAADRPPMATDAPTQQQNASCAPLPPRQRNFQFSATKPIGNLTVSAQANTYKSTASTGIRQQKHDGTSFQEVDRTPRNNRGQKEDDHSNDHSNQSNDHSNHEDKYAEDEFEDAFDEDEYSSGDDDFESEIKAAMSRKENVGNVVSKVSQPQRNQPTRLGRGVCDGKRYSYSDDDFVQDDDGSDFGYSDDEFERIA